MRLHALLALCAATAIAQAQTPPAGHVTTLSAPGGRYVFGQISESRRDQYLLDTQTGRLWVQTCIILQQGRPEAMRPDRTHAGLFHGRGG